jgi:hypothetical protein
MNMLAKTTIISAVLCGSLFTIGTANATNSYYLHYLKLKYHTNSATLALLRDRQAKALNPQPLPPCTQCSPKDLNPQPLPPLEMPEVSLR